MGNDKSRSDSSKTVIPWQTLPGADWFTLVRNSLTREDPAMVAITPMAMKHEAEADLRFALANHCPSPEKAFNLLRWGGQLVVMSPNQNEILQQVKAYKAYEGFFIDHPVNEVIKGFLGLAIPFLSKRIYYFVARKVLLIPPGQSTDRFTYEVRLTKDNSGQWVVRKEVPSLERVVARLRQKFPTDDLERITYQARKFTERIFPLFLTRETGMLKVLQKEMPDRYRVRVPQILDMEKDSRGFVKVMYMNWLRIGGKELSHLEFALQSADLLRALHDHAGIIHNDLRLDNMVITEHGVGFVDFGSAVRTDESFPENSLIHTLFEELVKTSQIQRVLGAMKNKGLVTSHVINNGYQKVDKAVDLFYLAVQLNNPHVNPDIKPFIHYESGSPEAFEISGLVEQVLRPKDLDNPVYKTAADLLEGLNRIGKKLNRT